MSVASSSLVAFIATRDAVRARVFYEKTLGLTIVADTPFALVANAHGTTLRIQKVQDLSPPPFTALGWEVRDIARTMAELTSRGVVFERYEFLAMDDASVWTTPDGAKVAWFKDPDGNVLSLTQL